MMRSQRSTKKDQLIDTALELFYRDGFHATGVDAILSKAGVARMTLYKHFRSKDDLILAALRRRDERFRDWFCRAVEQRAERPADRLPAVFDVLEEWITGQAPGHPPFSGCAFVKAAGEFGDKENPAHRLAAEHKRLVVGYLHELAIAAGAKEPRRLAEELNLLCEGAIVCAHVTHDMKAVQRAKSIAEPLIQAQVGPAD